MEGSGEKPVKASPWKQIPKFDPHGISFQDLLNESTQRKKEKQISGTAFREHMIPREIYRRHVYEWK